jgi:hypothetical protein
LLKNAHLQRSPHPSSLRRTTKYASLLRISGALHLGIFDQPGENGFFNSLFWYEFQNREKAIYPVRNNAPLEFLTGFTI